MLIDKHYLKLTSFQMLYDLHSAESTADDDHPRQVGIWYIHEIILELKATQIGLHDMKIDTIQNSIPFLIPTK